MRRRSVLRVVVPALLLPGAATLLALLPTGVSTTTAALAYVVAVMAASATGGLIAGLLASTLSFLGLNFFFTPPAHTFRVTNADDLAALVVFLAVSAFVAALLSTALAQRARAERREREARLLHHLATQLLGGRAVEDVLRDFAASAVKLFDLARCEITMESGEAPVVVERGERPLGDRRAAVIPMVAKDHLVGRIEVVPLSRPDLTAEEEAVIRTFAAQMALALETSSLAAEASRARMDAETSTMRAALFSSVTHDLRTPLASITAAVSNLQDSGARFSPRDQRTLLGTIRQEAERLNRLVGNLLDLARMRAGAVKPAKQAVAINEVVEGVVARLRPVLNGRDVRLLLREDLPDVPIDIDQIDQVVTNLVENAARFSPPGSPIRVSTAQWRDVVEVRVTDQGPGISPQYRQRVFEPFVRGDDPEQGGTGLGLSIARALVEAHGGTIWIDDAPGGGTAVIFRLPTKE